MFDTLLRRLARPDPDPLPAEDARLALAALLVRIARSDNDYAASEVARIDRVLATRFELTTFEAAGLRAKAEALEAQAPDTVRFTRAIKEAVPYEDRRAVVQSAWSVALADGERSNEEDALMRMIASLLGVSDVDSAMARQHVSKGSAS
ncbi:TerB family tellurite resistance protein [Chachezhania antarctica]|uniref:tellurite resistance TerB family protein n=1 Tax=Chachezhania antarctica TaxID=2340860 RepID=UPI000EB12CF9|nr:TerB family tellurite resistance protein [Chachezhania antarctica]